MFKNYLKIAWRNLARNKSYAFLNIFGLATGLACCILISLYVIHEWSYDKFHDNYDELYRVVESMEVDGELETYASTYSALAPSLKATFPEIEAITHIYPFSGLITGPDNSKYQEDNIILADSSFLEMFSFKLIEGNRKTALVNPNTVLITQKAAIKYFGNESPVGKTLSLKDSRNTVELQVTGLIETAPSNSHIQFDYILSYETLRSMRSWEYNVRYYPPMYTYAKVASPKDVSSIESYLPSFATQYYGEDNQAQYNNSFAFQPLADIHLRSSLQNELSINFNITYIYLFLAISIFILIIACINFMNLATARSLKRAREVGMRKTLGALRPQLMGQFLSEAVIMTAFGLVLAVILVEAFIPYFNSMSGKTLSFDVFSSIESVLVLLGLMLIVGIVSGSYPAFYLSSFTPIQSLKGEKTKQGKSSILLRQGLVVFQFFISTTLIFATIIVVKQLDFLKNERLGFDKDQVVMIHMRETQDQINASSLKQEMLAIPGIKSISATSGVPGLGGGISGFMAIPESNKADSGIVQTLTVDFGYVETLGLELIKGRDFSEDYGTDESSAFIINESTAKKFGWNNPVDEELTLNYWVSDLVSKKGAVVGVVKDFQYHSLHNSIDPVLLHVSKQTFYHDYMAVKLSTSDIESVIGNIQKKWKAFNPDRPLEYTFLDNTFDALYKSENQLSKIFNAFAFVAVLIACLGLFGLASYSTEQRVKEIGIRKVLGAKVSDIVTLLGREITLLIGLALLISLPLAYYLTNSWLNNFAERVDITIWLFILSAGSILIIAWVTISFQTIKTALMNPVKSLKSE